MENSNRTTIHPDVKAAVLTWARAADMKRGAKALKRDRRRLPDELHEELERVVAEVSVETLIRVLVKPIDGDDTQQTVEVAGEALPRTLVERFVAWLQDQTLTAQAMNIDPTLWVRKLEQGVKSLSARGGSDFALSPLGRSEHVERARKLLGAGKQQQGPFSREGGPSVGAREKTGLLGLLAARRFKRGDDSSS